MKELLSPVVSVEVLPAKFGEKVLVPSQWRRHILHEEWNDMLAMRRVSSTGGITGAFASSFAFPYLCSSANDPMREGEEYLPDYYFRRYSTKKTKLSVQIPTGYDAIMVDAPIRGVIPAPVVTNMRVTIPAAPHDYEDMTPAKYKYEEFSIKNGGMVGLHPTTGLLSLYSSINLVEINNPNGTKRVYPILLESGRVVELSVLGFRGQYMLATPIGIDVYEIYSMGRKITRTELLRAAQHNTKLMLEGGATFFLPSHPAAIGYFITQDDYKYNALTMREKGNETAVVPDYKRYTIASLYLETPPTLSPDFSFMFVIQLATPESQLYHLYSQTSVFRIFFGGHYMLDFIPGGASGVGSAYFYFFPHGYVVPTEVIDGRKPVANEYALVGGQAAALSHTYGLFHLGAYPPKPANGKYTAPFVHIIPISEMELWNLSRVSPGATAEAFLITCLRKHICIFRYSDLMGATSTGSTVKPIFAFNPLEHIKRYFGIHSQLYQYFNRHTIPPYTSVGIIACNTNAYISFGDFYWRGYSIASMPTVLAPSIHKYDDIANKESALNSKVYYYYPTRLVGTSGNPPKKLDTSPSTLRIANTTPPTARPLTGTPPAHPTRTRFAYPLVFYSESPAAHQIRVSKGRTPTIYGEVYEESGVNVSGEHSCTLSVVCSCPNEALAIYPGWNDLPITRKATTRRAGSRFCGVIPSLDLGIAPQYFPNYESWFQAVQQRVYLDEEPDILYEAHMPSLRFPMSPPVLHACDLVTVGIFSQGDVEWRNAVDLASLSTEIGIGSVIQSVSINLRGLAESTATINLLLPWEYNIEFNAAPTESDSVILSLPPLLAYVLKPYNLVRIRLGYTLWGEETVTISPVVFEGIIDSVGTRIGEQQAGGRAIQVTINCTDIYARMAQSTVEYEPPLDGWFFPDVLEHHMINSGISPHRIVSALWIPLGALSSFLLGENLFVGGFDAYYAYQDFPFKIDVGLDVLADAPRYTVTAGSRRLDVVKQAARLCGLTLTPTPYPVDETQLITFLDVVLRSQTYERFMPTLTNLVRTMKSPYKPSISGAPGMFIQALPVGSYALNPTWHFYINTTEIPDLATYPPETLFTAKVLLPDSPVVHGVFSVSLDAMAYQLPTLVRVEGRKVTGQPFFFVHHDYWTELVDRDGYRYKGFRIASTSQRNQNLVEPIQAFLAAWRQFLSSGYFPPIRCSLSVFGIPNIAPNHLIKITPPLRIIGHEILIPQSQYGLQYWVVDTVAYSWTAGSLPMAQLTLKAPHSFIVGLLGG